MVSKPAHTRLAEPENESTLESGVPRDGTAMASRVGFRSWQAGAVLVLLGVLSPPATAKGGGSGHGGADTWAGDILVDISVDISVVTRAAATPVGIWPG